MKTTAAAALALAAGAIAAPAGASKREVEYKGFIVPTVVANHDVNSNLNYLDDKTDTVREPGIETTTLYELPIPEAAAGKICRLVVFAGRVGHGDIVEGEQALDIFNNNIDNLAELKQGNLRNLQLARIRFDEYSGLFDFDLDDFNAIIDEFPCPAGATLEWESVSVGERNKVVIEQDFAPEGQENVLYEMPNGLSIAFY